MSHFRLCAAVPIVLAGGLAFLWAEGLKPGDAERVQAPWPLERMSLKELIAVAEDPESDAGVRNDAISAMGKHRDEDPGPYLMSLIKKDNGSGSSLSAAIELGNRKDVRAGPVIADYLRRADRAGIDLHGMVRVEMESALEAIGHPIPEEPQ